MGDPPADIPQDELERLYRAGRSWTGETTAYDGWSKAEPTRTLTARERDVLCGVIGDILGTVRRTGSMDCVGFRGGQDWLNHLVVIRDVINPRRTDEEEEDVD